MKPIDHLSAEVYQHKFLAEKFSGKIRERDVRDSGHHPLWRC